MDSCGSSSALVADFMGAKLDWKSTWPLPRRFRRFETCRAYLVRWLSRVARGKIHVMDETREKVCCRCRATKPEVAFFRKAKAKDGRQSYCKVCAHEDIVAWYTANKARHYAGTTARKHRNITALRIYVSALTCMDCGEADPVVLEFDHVRGNKVWTISQMLHNGWSMRRIMEEVAKCEVRCANCHKRRTYRGKVEFYRKLREGA